MYTVGYNLKYFIFLLQEKIINEGQPSLLAFKG